MRAGASYRTPGAVGYVTERSGVIALKHVLLAAAAALSLVGGASAARAATTLTFDELPYAYYAQTVVSQGYQFDDFDANSPIALFTWEAGSPYSADPDGRTLNNNYFRSTVTLTKVGGGLFDFTSVDLTDIYNNHDGQLGGDVLFSFFDGLTTTTQTVTVDALPGFQTFTFNRTGLVSLSFQAVTTNEVQTDNFVLDAAATPGGVPEPATWALMLTGFGLAGSALRRRRASPTA
jgi:hypothetical protein